MCDHNLETFVIAHSDDMEAEYGMRSDSVVTVIGIYNGDVFVVYGSKSFNDAKAELIENGAEASQISYL
jgi:hypothetical protein